MESLGMPYISAIDLKVEMKNQETLASELRHPEISKLYKMSAVFNPKNSDSMQIKEVVKFIKESLDPHSSLHNQASLPNKFKKSLFLP